MRFMVDSGEGRDTCSPERMLERRGASEFIGMVFHGYTITHVDTPAHYFWNGRIYNGRSCNLITSREGATVESVELLHDGVVSRGVLLDVAALKGRWLDSGEGVMPEDLDAAEQAQGVRVEPGDILLIRTGYYGRRLKQGPRNPLKDGSPAAHVACAPWFRERGVAMLGTDTHNDVSPLPYPRLGNALHIVSLVAMGLWLIDNGNLEDLAAACQSRGRWNFLLTMLRLATEREELRIVCDQFGAPTWSHEIAKGTAAVLLQLSQQGQETISKVGGIYHMTAAGQTSWFEFAKVIVEEASRMPRGIPWFETATKGRPLVTRRVIAIATEEYLTPARCPAYSVLSNAKLANRFHVQLPNWQSQLDSVFADENAIT